MMNGSSISIANMMARDYANPASEHRVTLKVIKKAGMSGTGQSRLFDDVRVTSAFPPIATKQRICWDVSNVPIGDIPSLA
jgi:hypothetical protein